MPLKIYRSSLFLVANLALLFAGLLVNLVLIVPGRKRARAQALLTMLWSRAMCGILGIRIKKCGRRWQGGGLTVCNHASYADVLVMGSFKPTVFLSNHEVRGWPLIGWLASLGGTVYVNRTSKKAALHAIRLLEQKIDCGITVIVFPEGTTSDGKSVRAFKSTFFSIPVRQRIAVRPAGIRYSDAVVAEVAWHGGAGIGPHFWNLTGIPKISVSVHFGASINPGFYGISPVDARKRLCAAAHDSVSALFDAGRQG
jgi:lyso-ornithine lipid O-acyltransferase